MDQTTRPTIFPRRPLRLQWLFSDVRPFYFITFNTYRRATILANADIHATTRQFFERAADSHDIAVGRYVIMPDHVHLFLAMPIDGLTLSGWLRALKTFVGKHLISAGHQKPHWQEGFFDHVLRSGESYAEKWDYVRMNPVRAGLCSEPDAWPYQGEIVRLEYTPL